MLALGWLKIPEDVFRLARDEARLRRLRAKPGYGERRVASLVRRIEAKRRVPLARFIVALGVRRIGPAAAETLARTYGTWARLSGRNAAPRSRRSGDET